MQIVDRMYWDEIDRAKTGPQSCWTREPAVGDGDEHDEYQYDEEEEQEEEEEQRQQQQPQQQQQQRRPQQQQQQQSQQRQQHGHKPKTAAACPSTAHPGLDTDDSAVGRQAAEETLDDVDELLEPGAEITAHELGELA